MALSTPYAVGREHVTESVARQLKGGKRDTGGWVFRTALQLCLALTIVILGVLLVDVVTGGWSVFATRFTSFMSSGLRSRAEDAGVFQGLRGSFWILVFVVVLAFPIGIGSALYLEEYAPHSRLTRFINVNIRNLAGVPSVVYGILGFTILVKSLGGVTGGRTVMAGGITLAILVLPIVIITAAEAVRAVPGSLREAGYGVGATRWEVTRDHVLPYAAPGILTGTVLALARALGEAAPLILVGAIGERLASRDGILDVSQLHDRFTAMPIVIAEWSKNTRPGFDGIAAAAIVVMLVAVLAANTVAILLRNRYEKKRG